MSVNLSKSLLLRYPNKRPVLVYPINNTQPMIKKNKFLVDTRMTMSEFLYSIKKYIVVDEKEAIFLFINDNILVRMSDLVIEVYEQYNRDGFLNIKYSIENTFG